MSKINILATQLAEIAAQKKELATKEEVIKDAMLAEMKKDGKEKESFDFGTISIATRSSYTYSDAVKKLEDKVKIKKDEEVKLGVAVSSVTEYVVFREAKVK